MNFYNLIMICKFVKVHTCIEYLGMKKTLLNHMTPFLLFSCAVFYDTYFTENISNIAWNMEYSLTFRFCIFLVNASLELISCSKSQIVPISATYTISVLGLCGAVIAVYLIAQEKRVNNTGVSARASHRHLVSVKHIIFWYSVQARPSHFSSHFPSLNRFARKFTWWVTLWPAVPVPFRSRRKRKYTAASSRWLWSGN